MTYPETHRTLYSDNFPGCDDEGEVLPIDHEMPVDHPGVDMRGGVIEPSERGDVSDSDDNDDMVFEMDEADLNGPRDGSGDAPTVQSPQISHHRATSHSYSQTRVPPLLRLQGHNRSRSSLGAASSMATPTLRRTAMSPLQRPGAHRTSSFPLSVPTHAAIAQPVVVPLSPSHSAIRATGSHNTFMGFQHDGPVFDTPAFATARAHEPQQSQFYAGHSVGSNVSNSPGPIPIPPPHSSSPLQQVQPHYPPGEVLHPHHPQHSRYFQSGSGSQGSQSQSAAAGRSLSRSSASRYRPAPSRSTTTPNTNTSLPPFSDHGSQAFWSTNMVLSTTETVGVNPAELVNPCVSAPCGVQVGDKTSGDLLDMLMQPMSPITSMTPVLERSTDVALQHQEAWKEQQQTQAQTQDPSQQLQLNHQEYVERKADEIKRQQEDLVSQRREEEEELARKELEEEQERKRQEEEEKARLEREEQAQSQTGKSDSVILYESYMALKDEIGEGRAPFQPFHQQIQHPPLPLSPPAPHHRHFLPLGGGHNTPLQEKLRAGIQKRTSAHLARERANAGGNMAMIANVSRGRPRGVSRIPGPASFATPHPHSAPPLPSPFGPPPPQPLLQPMQLPPMPPMPPMPPLPPLPPLPDSHPLPTLPLDFPYPPRGLPVVRQPMGPPAPPSQSVMATPSPAAPFVPNAQAAPFVPSGQQAGFVSDPTSQQQNQPVIAYGSKPYASGYVPPADRNVLYRNYRHYTYQSQPGQLVQQQQQQLFIQHQPPPVQQFLQVPPMNQAMLPLQHHPTPQHPPMIATAYHAPVQAQPPVVHDPPAGGPQDRSHQADSATDASMPDISDSGVTSVTTDCVEPPPALPQSQGSQGSQESPTPLSPPRLPHMSSPLAIRRQLSRRRGSTASAESVTSSGTATGTNISPPRILHPPRDPRALRAARAVRHPGGSRAAPSPAGQSNQVNPPAADEQTHDSRSQSFFDHDEDDDDGDGPSEEDDDGGPASRSDDVGSPPQEASSPETSASMSVSTSVSTPMTSTVVTSAASSLPSSDGLSRTSQSASQDSITLGSSGTTDRGQNPTSSSPHQPSSVGNPALDTSSHHSTLSTSAPADSHLSHLPLRPHHRVPDARSREGRRLADRVALEMTPIVPLSSSPPSVGKHSLEGSWSSHPTVSSSTEDADTGDVAAAVSHIEPLARRPDIIGVNEDVPVGTTNDDGTIDATVAVQQPVPTEDIQVEQTSQAVSTAVQSSSHAITTAVTHASTSSHHDYDYDSDNDLDDLLDLLDLPLTPIQIFLLHLPSSFWLSLFQLATLAAYHHHCFLVARTLQAKRNPPPPRPLPRWTWTCQCRRRHTVVIRPWVPIQLVIMAGPQWCDRCGDVEPVRGPDTVVWEPPAGPPGPPPPGPPPPPPGRPW